MQEFSSISVSSFEAGSLAESLTTSARDGWSVVAIVPTGSSVTAYLSREASSDGAHSMHGADATATAAAATGAAVTHEVDDIPAEVAVEVEAISEPATNDWSTSAAVSAADEVTSDVSAAMPDVEAPSLPSTDMGASSIAAAAEMVAADTSSGFGSDIGTVDAASSPVDEPAGWAIAPEPASPTIASYGEATPASAADTGASSYDTAGAGGYSTGSTDIGAAAAAVPAAASSAAPAGWYADPSSRFELRYWDGTQWTEHVSRAGQQYTDPPVA